MFFVYVLYSIKFDRHYVGITGDIQQRLRDHNGQRVISTKSFVPWKVIHVEEYTSRGAARIREKYLKSAAGRRWRKNNLGM